MNFDGEIAVYEWRAWSSFLFPTLFPYSTRIQAKLEDWDGDVIARLPPSTRFFVFHINMTYTAGIPHHRRLLCRRLERNGILTLNAEATNISKAFVQTACQRIKLQTTLASEEGDPAESLIIKTNWNYGGISESAISKSAQSLLGLGVPSYEFDAKSYKIVRRDEVAPDFWLRSDLIIERFIENRQHLFYRAYWLWSHLVISEVVDPQPLKKMPEGIKRKNWFFTVSDTVAVSYEEVPRSVRSLGTEIACFIQATKIDFGALDVVVDDYSNFFIIDLNTTPSWRDTSDPQILSFLQAGLRGGERTIHSSTRQ